MNQRHSSVLIGGLAIALAGVYPAQGSSRFVAPYCAQQNTQCMEYSLVLKTGATGGGYLDRIELSIDDAQCRPLNMAAPPGAPAVILNGYEKWGVDPGHATLKRSWLAPAGCRYKLHVRYPQTRPTKDWIGTHVVDPVTSEKDYCLVWDVAMGTKETSGCP